MIVEFVAGRVTDMLLKMIALYRPDCKLTYFSSMPESMGIRCPGMRFWLGAYDKEELIEFTALIVGTKGARTRLQSWGMALGGTSASSRADRID